MADRPGVPDEPVDAESFFELLLQNEPLPPNTILFGVDEINGQQGTAENASRDTKLLLQKFLHMALRRKFPGRELNSLGESEIFLLRRYFMSIYWDFEISQTVDEKTVVDYTKEGPYFRKLPVHHFCVNFTQCRSDSLNTVG
jgi:hypothetical protein